VAIVIDYLTDNGIIQREYYTRSDDRGDGAIAAVRQEI